MRRVSSLGVGPPPVIGDSAPIGTEKSVSSPVRRRKRSCTNESPPVTLNVYWQRSVTFDGQGRALRKMGGDELSWGNKFLKDVLGVYHVGIEVHGIEYTFGNYHAPSSHPVGEEPGSNSTCGVWVHQPRKAGPQCVFKEAVEMLPTQLSSEETEEICISFGRAEYIRSSYNRIHHNCVDFARSLCLKLDAGEIPSWCYRGAATAKLFGLGSPPEETDIPPPSPTKSENESGDPRSPDDNSGRGSSGAGMAQLTRDAHFLALRELPHQVPRETSTPIVANGSLGGTMGLPPLPLSRQGNRANDVSPKRSAIA